MEWSVLSGLDWPGGDVFWWAGAGLLVLLGLAGIVLPLLPGMPLLFAGLWLAAWLDGYTRVGGGTVLLLGLLAVAGALVDYVAAAIGVKRAGASDDAVKGAGLGALVGVLGGLPGLILGPILGAMAGEMRARGDPGQATRAGLAAGMGFLLAIAFKFVLALVMLSVFAIAWWI